MKNAMSKKLSDAKPDDIETERLEVNDKKNTAALTYRSKTVRTLKAALKVTKTDLTEWEVERHIINKWDMASKVDVESGSQLAALELWQVKIWFRRKQKQTKAVERLIDRLPKLKLEPVSYLPKKKNRCRVLVGLVDHHFGKLGWSPEVGFNYDLKQAKALWSRAISWNAQKCSGHNISEIILPIGNDMGHIDNRQGETERGTPQDTDGRYNKIAEAVEEATLLAIRTAREIAPVRVIWIPGNHDHLMSYWVCKIAKHIYSADKHVTVDIGEGGTHKVKYHQFGKCLLGLSHGDGPKAKALCDLMPIERADCWAKSKACREWITGHFHQQKATRTVGLHEESGMVFRTLPSLCGTDRWHYEAGFATSQKATQSFVYSEQYGLTDIFHAPIGLLER